MLASIPRLRLLERDRASGVFEVGEDGALELANGVVTHAESPYAPGPDRLAGTPCPERLSGTPGPEMLALIAVVDAAYFLLGSPAEPRFRSGERLTPPMPCELTVSTLVHEYERRRTLLRNRWPHGPLDHAPIIPVRRIRRQRVILTGLEAEILLNADGRRTPVDLALYLGRPVFACLLAVHDLAAGGLIDTSAVTTGGDGAAVRQEHAGPDLTSEHAGAALTSGQHSGATAAHGAPVAHGAAVASGVGSRAAAESRAVIEAAQDTAAHGPTAQDTAARDTAAREDEGLPSRRRKGVEVPGWEPPDLALLGRLRTALEELT